MTQAQHQFELAQKVLETEHVKQTGVKARPGQFAGLTPRETEMMLLLAVGYNHHDIADKFGVSVKTCDSHRIALMRKLKMDNNVQLARLALRMGWVEL